MLFISAVFAAAEASLFSLSRTQLEALHESRPSVYRRIRQLIFRPDLLLSTIVIGNECLNIMIATFVTALLDFHYSGWDARVLVLTSVLLSSILLLTCSEVLPKVLAFRMPVLTASVLVYPMSWVHALLTPLRKIFLTMSSEIIKWFGIQPSPPTIVSEKDFLTLVEFGAESGTLDRDEKEMIVNVFHFSDMTVGSVMTPWQKVFSLPDTLSIDHVMAEVRKKTYSRIPVFSQKENRVVGILYTKELLKLLLSPVLEKQTDAFKKAIFPPYIVSTHKKVARLFRELKLKKVHMALVVDEYGRHLGVVTLEDVLNALFQTQRKKAEGAV